jgi:hypothetical protein
MSDVIKDTEAEVERKLKWLIFIGVLIVVPLVLWLGPALYIGFLLGVLFVVAALGILEGGRE